MSGWQIPGFPSVPGVPDFVRLLQAQNEVLSQLPNTLKDLNRAVKGLADAVEASKSSFASVQRVSERIDALLDELEDPVRGLRPGLERVTTLLDDPALERIPPMLSTIERAVDPVAAAAERTRARLAAWREARRRLVSRVRRRNPS